MDWNTFNQQYSGTNYLSPQMGQNSAGTFGAVPSDWNSSTFNLNSYWYRFKQNPDGSVGVDYFQGLSPISNSEFSSGTGVNSGELESNPEAYGLPGQSTGGGESAPAPTAPSTGGSTGTATPGPTAEDEAAYYQDQIDNINRLLGSSDSRLAGGLSQLGESYNAQKTRQKNLYDTTDTQNAQDRQRGVEGVDTFANQSYNSLRRLLGSAGAGNSSAARTVVPTLVSNAASERRKGVFDVAGRNQANIDSARAGAEEDLGNWRSGQEKTLREGTANTGLGLLQKLRDLQFAKTQATGGGYEEAKSGAAGTTSMINDRMAQLDSLFGQFNPTYTANLTQPDLAKYSIDPGAIRLGQANPGSGNYYSTLFKKKQEQFA